MEQATNRKILGFNGLRGLSVIFVYLSHKVEVRFYAAEMGVWIFLALSGFLIIGELRRQRSEIEAHRYGPMQGARVFFIKRALRIFPAYYGLLVVLFLLRRYYAWAGPDLGFPFHFLYLSNVWGGFFAPHVSGPFGVLWSLSVEQQFYIIAPFVFLLTPAKRHLQLCLGFAILAGLAHLAMQRAGLGAPAIYLTSPWNLAIIALGGAGGMLVEQGWCSRALAGTRWLIVCLTLICAYGLSWLVFRTEVPDQAIPLFIVTLALVGVVAWVRVNQTSGVVKFLEWRPLEYLGVISYGFYLIHNFIPNPLGRLLPLYFHVEVPRIVTLSLGAALGFVISVTLAHLSWTFYERPILRLRSRLLPKNAEAAIAGEPSEGRLTAPEPRALAGQPSTP